MNLDHRKPKSLRLSLKTALVGVLLVTIGVTTGLNHISWLLTSRKSTNNAARQLNKRLIDETVEEVGKIFEQVSSTKYLIKRILEQEVINIYDKKQMGAVYLDLLETYPHFTWIEFGYPNGDFIGSLRVKDDTISIIQRRWGDSLGKTSQANHSNIIAERQALVEQFLQTGKWNESKPMAFKTIETYQFHNYQRELLDRKELSEVYYSPARPWYKVAAANPGKDAWTDIFLFATGNIPGIESSITLEKGDRLLGVISIAFSLEEISAYLQKLNTSGPGAIAILNSREEVVAFSNPEEKIYTNTAENQNLKLKRVGESNNLYLQLVDRTFQGNQLSPQKITSLQQYITRSPVSGERYFVSMKPLPYLDWVAVTVIPESYYLEKIGGINLETTIGLCLVSLVLTIGVCWGVSRWVVQPISRLSIASLAIAEGQLEQKLEVRGIKELEVLAQSFTQMAQQLKVSFTSLEKANEELEKRVKKRTQDLQRLANTDFLTRVANRRRFDEKLKQEWQHLSSASSPLSLILIDIDYFKLYNDTYGHQAGDNCLRHCTTAILQAVKRPTDLVARYGGEEFAAILPDTDLEGALGVAQRIREKIKALKIPHSTSPLSQWVSCSIGVSSLVPHSELNPERLIQEADLALYQAKALGRDRVSVHEHHLGKLEKQQSEILLVQEIKEALEENRFCLYAQKIVPLLSSSSYYHCEVLLRLVDRSNRVLLPSSFLPIAERYHLMPQIDRWVLQRLLTILAEKERNTWENYRFAVNLSGDSLNDEQFPEFVREQLQLYRIPPNSLVFEITETIAISNLAKTAQMISSLKTLGCSFALDDFGNGMCSLAYLKKLPVDYIKIDGVFVKEIVSDPVAKSIVEAIRHLGNAIGLKLTAEFVENKEIFDILQGLKIDYAQGYYLAAPIILEEVLEIFLQDVPRNPQAIACARNYDQK